ncbi:uncharacterized protein LOC108106557 [Drosophila eugracilis]|uniref:uncharacterized protein LOC108106557 n=1 Tax=Drosophila eugracilis TaxID=29029 RepID=UPI0007E71EBC|nr:uncharacterized protein LOC108106557 [Drosophila eugracilis]
MKLTLVILLAIGHLTSSNDVQTIVVECAKKEGVSDDLLRNHPTDMRVKCLAYCQYERTKVIVNNRVSIQGIPNAKPCLGLRDTNKCELGYKLKECLSKYLTGREREELV